MLARGAIGATAEGRVRHVSDLVRVAILNGRVVVVADGHGALVQHWRPDGGRSLERLEIRFDEVGDADLDTLPCSLGLFKCAPGGRDRGGPLAAGVVDEREVDDRHLEVLEIGCDVCFCVGVRAARDLGGDVHAPCGYSRVGQPLGDRVLVAVHVGCVDGGAADLDPQFRGRGDVGVHARARAQGD